VFQTFIEQPIFNLLELIYAVVPGHDLGVAIIIFTAIVRMALWPFVKRQLHQSRAMRKLQPELKKIKKAANGDRQKLARLQMELYKEHGVKPLATIGTLIIQVPIFIALFFSIRKLIEDPNVLFTFAYEPIRNLAWIQTLANDMSQFSHTLFGVIDLAEKGVNGGIYLPAIILAVVAATVQFYQSKMMLPDSKDAKKLSQILKDAAEGNQADQSEVSASISRLMLYFLPFVTFIFAIILPSALTLYLLTNASVGYAQQWYVLRKDEEELEEISEEQTPAAEEKPKSAGQRSKKKAKKSSKKKKRR
jgi:YidC/Oxa1 family membrane protein insertase